MKRILITGAAGFIGFHLAFALKKIGLDVLGLDNFNDYYSVQLKKDRAQILSENNVPVLNVDLTDRDALSATFQSFEPTHVVNLAAQAGVRYSLKILTLIFKVISLDSQIY